MLAALNHKDDHGECWHSPKWESRFILELNTTKSIDYIEKCFTRKLRRIKFPAKNSMEAYLYLPQKWSQEAPKICQFWNTVTLWNGKVGSLWDWKLQKILIILKNASNRSCVYIYINLLQKTDAGVEVRGSSDLALWFYQKFYLKTILYFIIILSTYTS